jgi:hypothetical protein
MRVVYRSESDRWLAVVRSVVSRWCIPLMAPASFPPPMAELRPVHEGQGGGTG